MGVGAGGGGGEVIRIKIKTGEEEKEKNKQATTTTTKRHMVQSHSENRLSARSFVSRCPRNAPKNISP